MAKKKKQIGTVYGAAGPYGAADFYRNGGQLPQYTIGGLLPLLGAMQSAKEGDDGKKMNKKQIAMKMLPMLMGLPPMQEGGYIPDMSDELSKLSASIYGGPAAANMAAFMKEKEKRKKEKKSDKKKSDVILDKDGIPKKTGKVKEAWDKAEADKVVLDEANVSSEYLDTTIPAEDAIDIVGDSSTSLAWSLPTQRYGGLTSLYKDGGYLPMYSAGGPMPGQYYGGGDTEAPEEEQHVSKGGAALKGAATGAAIGALVPIPGAPLVGAAIGAGVGFFNAGKANKEADEANAEAARIQAENERRMRDQQRAEAAQSAYADFQGAQQEAIAGAEEGIDVTGHGVELMRQGGLVGAPQYEAEGGEVLQNGGITQVYGQGEVEQMSNNLMKINGPQHEEGGVKMESSEQGRIFSDKLRPKGNKETYAKLAEVFTDKINKLEENTASGDPIAANTQKYMKQRYEGNLDELFNDQETMKADKAERKAKRDAKKMEGLPQFNAGGYLAAIGPAYNIYQGLFGKLDYATAEQIDAADYSRIMQQQQKSQERAAKGYKRMAKEAGDYETYNPAAELAAAREAAARARYDMRNAGGGNLRALMAGSAAAQRAQTAAVGSVLGKKQQMDIAAREQARQRRLGIEAQALQTAMAGDSALAQIMMQQEQANQQAMLYNAQAREKNQLYRLQAKGARQAYLDQGMADIGGALYAGQALS